MDSSLQGELSSKLWLVSKAPHTGEGIPMESSTNGKIMSFLYANGITRKDIRIDYLSPGLRKRIEEGKPNLVLGFGKEVLKELVGREDIMKWRGHIMEGKYLFTLDPVSVHRQSYSERKNTQGQYDLLQKVDLKKAIKECEYPETRFEETPLKTCIGYDDAVNALQHLHRNSEILAFDIEVLKPYEGRLVDCISFANQDGVGICIPLWSATNRIWTNEKEFIHLFSLIKILLGSEIPKVGQNGQYDITTLEYYYDVKVNNYIWDTMVVGHTLFCDLPKDLGTLISLYANIPYHKYMIHSTSMRDRWEYSAADSMATLHVMAGQKAKMCDLDRCCEKCTGKFKECLLCPNIKNSSLYFHYMQTINPNIRHIVNIQKEGVKVNMEYRESVVKLEENYRKDILKALKTILPKEDINPKSPKIMTELFYDRLGCTPIYAKGKKLTFNKEARKSLIAEQTRIGAKSIAALLIGCDEYIMSDAAQLSLKTVPHKEHIRTLYKPEGTDSGRFASTQSDIIPGSANLQNIQKGPQRAILIPENKDEEFLHADLYAAEAFLTFLDAQELDGIRSISGLSGEYSQEEKYGCRVMAAKLSDRIKIHNWLLNYIREEFPKRVEEAKFNYKGAKQLIHAMNYNVQPPMMAKESGLNLSTCRYIYHMYHRKYPGIRRRMLRIDDNLRRRGMLETPLGRRRYFLGKIEENTYNIAYSWTSQSTIAEVTNGAMCHCRNWSGVGDNVLNYTVMNTHDGLVNRIKRGTREQAIRQTLDAFNREITLRGITITIPVSISFGDNYNENSEEMVYFYPMEI